MSTKLSWVAIALSLFTIGYVVSTGSHQVPVKVSPSSNEPAFEHVQKTGVLRCAYYIYPPWAYKDANSGRVSGVGVEMIEKLADTIGLKVEWSEEVTFGNWTAGLQAGRYDAVCPGTWVEANQTRVVSFTSPIWYAALHAFAREDDHRFDNNLSAINDPAVTITTLEGDSVDSLARQLFPRAKILAMAPNSDYSSVVQNVVAGKADVVFWDYSGMNLFRASNPGQLRDVAPGQVVRVTPTAIPVSLGEYRLRDMLDAALAQMQGSGLLDQYLDRFEAEAGATGNFRVAHPYRAPASPGETAPQ